MENIPNKTEEKYPGIRFYEFNISKAVDTEEEIRFFIDELKEQNLYGPEFRYCTFEEEDIGKNESTERDRQIFCSMYTDIELDENMAPHMDNPLVHATYANNPVVGVYDIKKLSEKHHPLYQVLSDDALIAVIKIKF